MTNQHDIADECEHRLDPDRFNQLDIDCGDSGYLDMTELRADLARYAAHMRKQAERIAELERDEPEADGTDAAHPAWWRGHEQSCAVFCQKVNEILDGKDDGAGVNHEPWGATRRRLIALLDRIAEREGRYREALQEISKERDDDDQPTPSAERAVAALAETEVQK